MLAVEPEDPNQHPNIRPGAWALKLFERGKLGVSGAVALGPNVDSDKLTSVLEPLALFKVDSSPIVFEDVQDGLEVVQKLLLVSAIDQDVVDDDFGASFFDTTFRRQRLPFPLKFHHHCNEGRSRI